MESIYNELALDGSKNECARTANDFPPISEVCNGTVSLIKLDELCSIKGYCCFQLELQTVRFKVNIQLPI